VTLFVTGMNLWQRNSSPRKPVDPGFWYCRHSPAQPRIEQRFWSIRTTHSMALQIARALAMTSNNAANAGSKCNKIEARLLQNCSRVPDTLRKPAARACASKPARGYAALTLTAKARLAIVECARFVAISERAFVAEFSAVRPQRGGVFDNGR